MNQFCRFGYWKKIVSGLMAVVFMVGFAGASSYVQNFPLTPLPGSMVSLSEEATPPLLKGIRVYSDDPFRLDFILDKGHSGNANNSLKSESIRLLKYFLASVTVPEQDLWVNLSPYEKDLIVPDAFGVTQMGRDLLEQDRRLKQITASVLHPDAKLGKAFWARVYAEAWRRYGTSDIPVDAFNKVWIVPDKAVVYEHGQSAYVRESRLKVMLETDYLATSIASLPAGAQGATSIAPVFGKDDEITQAVLREVIIPVLEKEVNEGENFALLRQVYHSLILAIWYKDKVKESLLGDAYVDQSLTAGIDIEDKMEKYKIWVDYVKAFREGAYNYIKEEVDPVTRQPVPRQYFSGGASFGNLRKSYDLRQIDHDRLFELDAVFRGVDMAMLEVKLDVAIRGESIEFEDGEVLWKDALEYLAIKKRVTLDHIVNRLKNRDVQIHALLRDVLSKQIARLLGQRFDQVLHVWLFGSVNEGTPEVVGSESDIDLIVEVASEGAIAPVRMFIEGIDRILTGRFVSDLEIHIPYLIDLPATSKLLTTGDIRSGKGYAQSVLHIRDRTATLLFSRDNGRGVPNSSGGVDLTQERMHLKTIGSISKTRFNVDLAPLGKWEGIIGLTPVIVNIHSLTDLKFFLGVSGTIQGASEFSGSS